MNSLARDRNSMSGAHTSNMASCKTAARVRQAVLVGTVLVLSGCTVPDYLNPLTLFEGDAPATQTDAAAAVRARGLEAEQAAQAGDFPRLSSVPERPTGLSTPGLRQRVVEGLIADRANARYTDDAPRVIRPASGPVSAATPDPAAEVAAAAAQEAAEAGSVRRPPVPPRPGTNARGELLPSGGSGDLNVVPAEGPLLAARQGVVPPTPPVRPAGAPDPGVLPGGATTAGLAPGAGALAQPLTEPLAVIQFADGSSNLDTRDIDILRQVARISGQTGAAVRVIGHASGGANTPAAQRANQDVSVARARAVAQALVVLGVPPQQVSFEGRSDLVPLYDETTGNGTAGNRRAEVFLNL